MSVQNALTLIQKLRQDKNKLKSISSLKDMAYLSAQFSLICTEEELRKAFQADWKMRWVKYNAEDTNDQFACAASEPKQADND